MLVLTQDTRLGIPFKEKSIKLHESEGSVLRNPCRGAKKSKQAENLMDYEPTASWLLGGRFTTAVRYSRFILVLKMVDRGLKMSIEHI